MIKVFGARVHNLKNIDVEIPHKSLTVITGLSGSGKSSLAFDTIYAEGQRRYIETFSAYARNFLGGMERPDVDEITGLSPVISIEQKTTNRNPRSTVGTTTEVYDYLRLLYARAGTAYSYISGEKMVKYTEDQIFDMILRDYAEKKILILAPLVRNRKGHYRELFEQMRRKGFIQVRIDGEITELTEGMKVDRYVNHNIEVVVDKLKVSAKDESRLHKTIELAMRQGDGLIMILDKETSVGKYYSRRLMDPVSGIAFKDPAPNIFSFNSPEGACPYCKGLGYVEAESRKDDDDDEADTPVCPLCQGRRLNEEALSYRICDKNIAELSEMDIDQLYDWLGEAPLHMSDRQREIASEIIKEIRTRLKFMLDVGLDYLALGRHSKTLSGGESQRIRLATQIGSQLVNVLYILDEPSIGLHQRDNQRLINSLKQLRDIGNTIIVVEHDQDMMLAADYVIDIGPKAGRKGGEVVFQGTPDEMLRTNTLTAEYLKNPDLLCRKVREDVGNDNDNDNVKQNDPSTGLRNHNHNDNDNDNGRGSIILRGACGNNLKNVDAVFPLGKLIVVTGVSGSGKSTLINDTLQPILSKHFYHSLREPMPYSSIEGIDLIDKVVNVDQTPLGRTPRSNPATYTGVFSDIRSLFISLPEAKIRGYKPGRFSFNVKGGRCEACGGNGYKTIEMNFLPDVMVPCEECQGKRYNRETLEVRYKGKSIADVLDMTVNQAVEFFESVPHILKKIKTLQDVGLGYIKLGQSSTTLSGGESQRVKLAAELAKRDTGKTLYILDEPTTGLHFEDIRILMNILLRLVSKGNTVIIIEHNLDVIRLADHIIDMGPEGGRNGGTIVATGTVDEIKRLSKGYTAQYL